MITTALQYSGGKDSCAVLHMYREQLNNIVVVWVNSGAAYPGVIEHMETVKAQVPHFLTVYGKQPENIKQNGYPTDVVPMVYSPLGRLFVKSAEAFKLQSVFDCCAANIWHPLNDAMKLYGIKTVIRGQRREEQYTGPIKNGHVDVQGITYLLPLEDWTSAQVSEYLTTNNVELPAYYATEKKSHDCWNCTGYLSEDGGRIANLPAEQRAEVERRLQEINKAVELESAPLKNILKAS